MAIDSIEVEFPPGMEVASMRLLSPNRALVTGRTFVPTDIAGLGLWLKSDWTLWQDAAQTVPAVADNDPVGVWDDASGNANNATEATNRPTLKLNIQNGKPVIRFDGTNDLLTVVHAASLAYTDLTIFNLVIVRAFTGGNPYFQKGYAAGTAEWWFRLNTGANKIESKFVSATKSTGDQTFAGASSTGVAYLSVVQLDTTNSTYLTRLNGAAVASGSTSNVTQGANTSNIKLAVNHDSSQFEQVDFLECLVYTTALIAGDIARVENYLNAKYAIY